MGLGKPISGGGTRPSPEGVRASKQAPALPDCQGWAAKRPAFPLRHPAAPFSPHPGHYLVLLVSPPLSAPPHLAQPPSLLPYIPAPIASPASKGCTGSSRPSLIHSVNMH